MLGRYERNLPALTEADCALLREKKVAVIGCGGLGGYLVEYLARIGIGAIRVVDGDVFEPTNLNRQLLALPGCLGAGKAETAAARIRTVNPEVSVEVCHTFLEEANALQLVSGCDAVLDALDNIPTRRILERACEEAGIPCIYGAISGWVAQAAVILPGDRLMERLYPQGTVVREKSVLSFTPAMCAAVQMSLCIRLLTGRPVEPGKLLYFDLLSQEFESIPLV